MLMTSKSGLWRWMLPPAAVLGLASGLAVGQTAGTLDPSFGTGGQVTTVVAPSPTAGAGSPSPLTAFEQSNGNISVVTGIPNPNVGPNLSFLGLVQYTSAGKLVGTTPVSVFPSGINTPSAAAMQSNGDIVVAGTASPSIDSAEVVMLVRFLPTEIGRAHV